MAGQNQFLRGEPPDLDFAPPREPAAARTDGHDAVAAERFDRKMQVGRRAIDDGEVHLAPVQPLDQMTAIAFHDQQRDVGQGLNDAAGEAGRQDATDRRHQSQHHASGRASADRLQIVADLFDLPDQSGGPVQQELASCGQQHAAAVAGEKLGAKLMFKQLDLPAQRRLGHPQTIGGLAEAPEFGDRAKGTKLA